MRAADARMRLLCPCSVETNQMVQDSVGGHVSQQHSAQPAFTGVHVLPPGRPGTPARQDALAPPCTTGSTSSHHACCCWSLAGSPHSLLLLARCRLRCAALTRPPSGPLPGTQRGTCWQRGRQTMPSSSGAGGRCGQACCCLCICQGRASSSKERAVQPCSWQVCMRGVRLTGRQRLPVVSSLAG